MRAPTVARLLAAVFCVVIGSAQAAEALPPWFTGPAEFKPTGDDTSHFEDYGESGFRLPGADDRKVVRGRHWTVGMSYAGAASDTEGKVLWSRIRTALAKGGWTFPGEYDENPYSATFELQAGGRDAWGSLSIFGVDDLRLELVEVAKQPLVFALKPPAASAEKVPADHGDFPYLAPLPGSSLNSSSRDDEGTMLVKVKGEDEPLAVGSGYLIKDYTPAPHLSTLQFSTVYRDALAAAGWTIESFTEGVNVGDTELFAHYAKNGRDLWSHLHLGGGNYSIQVADVGGDDLAKKLAADCHAALYGVLFDFNKATLKPESDPVLQRVLGVLQKDAALKVEVQGHTDNVGGDASNQKLSEARAGSVMAWLVGHGITADRLTAKGYGLRQPVADNESDEGRAKNRRVEIAKAGCGK